VANAAATASTILHTLAVSGLTAAYHQLTVAMMANPIGLIVAAIVAVVAAAVYMIKYHWESCRKALTAIWNGIVDAFTFMLNVFLKYPPIAIAMVLLEEIFISLGEVADAVFGLIGSAAEGFGRTVEKVSNFVSKIADTISDAFNDLWKRVTGSTNGLGESLKKFMDDVLPNWAKEFIGWLDKIITKGWEMADNITQATNKALKIEATPEDERKAFNMMKDTNGQRYTAGTVTKAPLTLGGTEEKKKGKEKTPFDIAKAEYDFDISMHQYTQAQKLEIYRQYVDEVEKTEDELLEYKKTIYSMERGVQEEELAFKKAELDMFVLEHEGSMDAIYQKSVEVANAEIALYAEGTIEYRRAMDARKKIDIQYAKDKSALAQKIAEEESKIRMMANSAAYQDKKFLADLDMISKRELLQAERDYIIQKALEERALAQAEADNMNLSLDKRREYSDKVREIDLQLSQDLQANSQEMWKEVHKNMLELKNSTKSAFSTLFNELLTSTTKFRELLRNFAKGILKTIAGQMSDRWAGSITDKLFGSLKRDANKQINQEKVKQESITTIAKTGEETRLLNAKIISAQVGAMGAAEATTMISATQAAFTGMLSMMTAMASAIASIPPEGSAMAAQITTGVTSATATLATAAQAATAGVNTAFSVKSGAGGYKVPYDQLMKVHEDEVVLPKRLSDGFEKIIGSMGGNSTSNQVNVPVQVEGNVRLAGRLRHEVEDLVVKIIAQEARA
jgi:hypothetical protein